MNLDSLTDYLCENLIERGFPANLNLYYRLSYCQGDGVGFYGDLSKNALEKLLPYLFPNQIRKVKMLKRLLTAVDLFSEQNDDFAFFTKKTVTDDGYYPYYSNGGYYSYAWKAENDPLDFSISGETGFYHHAHSMTLECLNANEIWYFEESMKSRWYFKSDRLQNYMDLWDELVDTLKNYIVETSVYLEKLGYEYIEVDEEAYGDDVA